MSKKTPAVSVLTGNRLHDGIVVFLGTDGAWVEGIEHAAVARTPEEAEAFEGQGVRAAAANLVVEPYLAEVREVGGRLVPVRVRERVRVEGPSVLDDVPGYEAPPPSPRTSPASPRTPTARGEGRGEGQRHTPTSAFVAAPHPSPLPASGERGPGASGERASLIEAA